MEGHVQIFEKANSLWLETRTYAEQIEAVQIAVQDIEAGLALIAPVMDELISRRAPVSAYQSMLTQHSLLVSDVRDQIELADRDFRRNLFKINTPPIWAIADMTPGMASMVNPVELVVATTRRFVQTATVQLSFHLLLMLAAIAHC